MGGLTSKPKVDRSAQKAADAEAAKLKKEQEQAESERVSLLEQRNLSMINQRKKTAGRSSLITNVGGELGTQEKLG